MFRLNPFYTHGPQNWWVNCTNPLEQFIFMDSIVKCPFSHGSVLGVLLLVPIILLVCVISHSNVYEYFDVMDTDTINTTLPRRIPKVMVDVIAINVDMQRGCNGVPSDNASLVINDEEQTITFLFANAVLSFILDIVSDNLLIGHMVIYIPYLYFIFNLILFGNILGLLPFSVTITSTFIITLSIALTSFIGINVIGWVLHGIQIFKMFLPKGVPLYIAPMLVVIELFSYLIRVLSVTVRLFANILAGHALLKILITSSWSCLHRKTWRWPIANLDIWLNMTPIYLLECVIAALQAYVFVLLLTIYLNDVFNLH